ncbi:hypothetical protein RhiirA5_411984 [Rhizophagus irregularis]|uniref:Uncharacterized protein n=1 Tax=Rhizophagus irregularis TaxID=588596 RepID=A0A2I1EMB7_9GLOM|nr:hypothetical protein RhiirA5_411984 [Rhizophagus irregularis]PKY23263.1 hypothetical protein RhiirB3_437417 [Rhizophagus irregularis]
MIILSQACKFSSVKNAKTFATLIYSSVGTKEVVHIIFKGMPLIDGGVDPRISKSCEGFTNLSDDFARIAGDWFIIEEQPYYDDIETNNEHGNFTKNYLRIGDVVMMQMQDYNEAIFSYKGNDNKLYVFIIVKWFEKTNQIKLVCPLHRIQTDNRWRHVFPLSAIDLINNAIY